MQRIKPKSGPPLLRAARLLAEEIHRGQRYGCDPKFSHVRAVSDLIARHFPSDGPLQAAAFLHDALKDAPQGLDAATLIQAQCGPEVLRLVRAVTKDKGLSRSEAWRLNVPRIIEAGPRAIALKLADRICNVRYSAARESLNAHGFYIMYRKEHRVFRADLFLASVEHPRLLTLWSILDELFSWVPEVTPEKE